MSLLIPVTTVSKLPPRPDTITSLTGEDEIPEEKAHEVIQKAKVEDDEYKNQSEEHTYYG